ncbi:hypothetical protein OAO01_05475 [Oligoflexia bacterium]|nr:hypothetical protein [Oligoflexia bacterium]
MMKFFYLLTILFWIGFQTTAIAEAQRAEAYYQRVVQTLLDTEQNKKSEAPMALATEQTKLYLISDSLGKRTYAKTYKSDSNPPLGVFRITVGSTSLSNLRPLGWRKAYQDPQLGLQVWSRNVTIQFAKRVELFARKRSADVILGLRVMFDTVDQGKEELSALFTLFWANAEHNGLFEAHTAAAGSVKQIAPSPQQRVRPTTVSGPWSGPMRNSRGDTATASLLIIKEAPDGKITGAWHAGWKIQNGSKKGRIITWEHTGLFNGCRDYKNHMRVAEDGFSAELSYTATDRCREPKHYTGTARLQKE